MIRNVPNYQAPPNSLVDGQNVYIDEDGLLKTRQGYVAVGPAISPAERITGLISYRDQSGNFVQVVGTIHRWQKYNGDGTFTNLDGGAPYNGDADDPVRFVAFAQGGLVWVYGVNNQNGLYGWNSGLSAFVQIIGGVNVNITNIVGNGTTATVNTTSGNPIGIKDGDTVTIVGNTVSAFNGPQIVTGILSASSFTFVTSSSSTGTGGTVNDPQGGAPFASARDIAVVANRVVVVNTNEGGTQFSTRVRWSAFNDGQTWPALALNDLLDSNDAIVGIARSSRVSAIIYRDASAWLLSAYPGNDASAFTAERIQTSDDMTGPCGPAAIAIAEGSHYYLGQDGRVYTFDGNSIYPISDAINSVFRPILNTQISDRVCAVYLPAKRGVFFFAPTGTQADAQTGIMYSIPRRCFEPLMLFADQITACAVVQESSSLTWNNWVSATATWDTIPFTSWDSIPFTNALNTWIATPQGLVERFFVAPTDNGVVIPYFAVYPPIRQDPTTMQRVSYIELYLQQATSPEMLGGILDGLLQPYTTPGTPIMAIAVQLNDQSTFQIPVEPGPNNSRNIPANFLQLTLNSAGSLAQLAFAGGTIFVDMDLRGDEGVQ